jgi:hypothetical protein
MKFFKNFARTPHLINMFFYLKFLLKNKKNFWLLKVGLFRLGVE